MEVGLTSATPNTPSPPRYPRDLGSMDEDFHILLFSSGAVGTMRPGCNMRLRQCRHTHLLFDVPSSASQGQGRVEWPSCDFFLSRMCEEVETTMEESDQLYQTGL